MTEEARANDAIGPRTHEQVFEGETLPWSTRVDRECNRLRTSAGIGVCRADPGCS